MPTSEAIEVFLAELTEASVHEALSEAKRLRVRASPDDAVVVTEGDDIVAVAVPAAHRQPDGATIWELETAVRLDMQFPEFEQTILDAGLEAVPKGATVSVWSSRSSLTEALLRSGFAPRRTLAHMVVALPLDVDDPGTDGIRQFGWEDLEGLIAVNGRAFSGHPEAGGLDAEQFTSLAEEAWFTPTGILVASVEGAIIGFCWTKVHDDGSGEIYRIAVDPTSRGRGLGRKLTIAGFNLLAAQAKVTRGTLWVDRANVAALRLYEDLGLQIVLTNTAFERAGDEY